MYLTGAESNLSTDAGNQETLPVVQHGLLQKALLSLTLETDTHRQTDETWADLCSNVAAFVREPAL